MRIISVIKRPYRLLVGLLLIIVALTFFTPSGLSPVSDDVVLAAPLSFQLPEVSFVNTAISVTEPGSGQTSTISIAVQISAAPATDLAVTVDYLTVNGSAVAGVDYEQKSDILTFPAGSTDNQTFDVIIRNNISSSPPQRTFSVFLTNAVNAGVSTAAASTIVTIVNSDPTPTPTSSSGTATPAVFLDDYEPNNDFSMATTVNAGAAKLTEITLWPVGDQDYFQFYGKKGATYQPYTTDLEAGLDTILKVYDPDGDKIAENDDISEINLSSQLEFTADENGFYFARILNKDPSNPTNLTYSFGVNLIEPPTPTPSPTLIGTPDACEDNNARELACLIGTDEVKSNMNFVPPIGTDPDTDYYRLAVKVGITYTCETQNLTAITDTNMIFLDNNGGDFNPQLGNDDRAPGDRSSLLTWTATYTGDLYILIGPVNPPAYEDTPLTGYNLSCTGIAATPTPTATATRAFVAPPTGPGGGGVVATPTAVAFPTFPPTPTPIDLSGLVPTPAPPPIVDFQPLPTSTPALGGQQTISVQVTVYYDSNYNYTAELTEGIMDVAVELYNNTTNELIAFGYTNEAGLVRFDAISSTGAVRLEVSYLNYSQVLIGASANILLRVEPRPLPSGIP